MSINKFSSLNKAIFEQIRLSDDAVVADLGCRDAGFLVGLQQAFPDKIHQAIAWLYKENTGALTKEEYDMFIDNLKSAQQDGSYIFSKPYYIYKGVKL